jgi:hypothetical protein
MGFLIDHLPGNMHLVITTREDPDLPLARLRARDHLTEIRAMDLRFTQEETDAFLRGVMGLELSQQEMTVLETRTEGWAVGLQPAGENGTRLLLRQRLGYSSDLGWLWRLTEPIGFVMERKMMLGIRQRAERYP